MIVEEHLQAPTMYPDGGQPLDAVRRLDVRDVFRQQQGRPHLGTLSGARRLARRVDVVAIQRQTGPVGQDHSHIGHVLGLDHE
jgi:hypothetical protein